MRQLQYVTKLHTFASINFTRNVYRISFGNVCQNAGINKTFTMSDNPENDKSGGFIRELIDLISNNDIPISDVTDILGYLCCT